MSDINVNVIFEMDVNYLGQVIGCRSDNGDLIRSAPFDPSVSVSFAGDDLISMDFCAFGGSVGFEDKTGAAFGCCPFLSKWIPCFAAEFPEKEFNTIYLDETAQVVKMERYNENGQLQEEIRFEEGAPGLMRNPSVNGFSNIYKLLVLDRGGVRRAVLIGPDQASATGFSIWQG